MAQAPEDESPTRTEIAGITVGPITRIERLVLRWRDQRLVLDKDSKPIIMGRSNHADIPIDSNFASREHASLSYMRACFVLTDRSSNGTYVNMNDDEVYIHHDELILRGSGCISLGRRAASSPGKVVYFSSETAVPPIKNEAANK